jgi:hypothetical protein
MNGCAGSAASDSTTLTSCADTSPKSTTKLCHRACMNIGRARNGSERKIHEQIVHHARAIGAAAPYGLRCAPSAKGCGSFAKRALRASATSTHRPLPLPETKARRQSRQQHRRRAESESNAACRPCSSLEGRSRDISASFHRHKYCSRDNGTARISFALWRMILSCARWTIAAVPQPQ